MIAGARVGGWVEFEEFAAIQAPALLRDAVALTGDLAAGEDLVQDVLIKLHAEWSRISRLDYPKAYARRMLVNEFLSWRRRWGRYLPFADIPVTREDVVDAATAHADRSLLRAEVSRLPRPQQVVLMLRYYAGLTDTEIADAMGCRPGTVRSHASRALARLRGADQLRTEYHASSPAPEGTPT